MSFGSISFLLFIIAVFLVYWGVPHKYRWVPLLAANTVFYISFDAKCITVLIYIIVISYLFGLLISKNLEGKIRKLYFILSLIFTIMPLFLFKYLNFAIYSVQKVMSFTGISPDEHTLKLLMPVGISFYTFEAISYICDIKSGKIKAESNIFKYAIFVSFFPNITSGPIERAGSFIEQINKEKTFSYDMASYAMRLMLLGMLKKYVCADLMVKYISNVFDNVIGFSGVVFIIATVMYTFQIYFDFSGYTDMARAVAMLLGFELRENFNKPYFASGIKDFWSRWHISLSNWLRDYIYIPLGGNRKGKFRKNLNLIITFLVSGLWHGASFTFIVWGLIHGLAQCVEGLIPYKRENGFTVKKVVRVICTFCVVSFAWMFFRANSLAECVYIIKNMFLGGSILGAFQSMGMTKMSIVKVLVCILFVMIYDFFSRNRDLLKDMSKLPIISRWAIYVLVTVIVVVIKVHEGTNASFIYFSF
ncbi:MAG: MBOAT family O-acyltransferase [Lachnospiraceae bacterium]|nr:MBOAT family O-acyltransferase [Lachnospiraceae bacterium]